MTFFLGRSMAALAAGAVVLASASVVATAGMAHADAPFSGRLNGKNGSATVAKAGLHVAACADDCLRPGRTFAGAATAADGAFTGAAVATGSYVIAVTKVASLPGFAAAPQQGYLHREPNGQWNVVQSYAGATKVTVSGTPLTFTLANAIHNPKDQFTQTTVGSGSYRACAGRVTSVTVSAFSDAPAGTTVRYQWAAGRSAGTRVTIPGATGRSYRPTAAMTGLRLYMELTASAPNRTTYDRLAPMGTVGNPLTCASRVATMPTRYVTSFGAARGQVKVGRRVAVVGAKTSASARKKYRLKVTYTWKASGSIVGKSRTLRIPRTAKGKKLTVTVSVKAAGFKPRAKTLRLGRVR